MCVCVCVCNVLFSFAGISAATTSTHWPSIADNLAKGLADNWSQVAFNSLNEYVPANCRFTDVVLCVCRFECQLLLLLVNS